MDMKQVITMIKSPTVFINDKDSSLIYPLILHIINILLVMIFIGSGLDVFTIAGYGLIGVTLLNLLMIIINVSYNEVPFSDYIKSTKQWFKLAAFMNLFATFLILITDLMYAGRGEFVYGITLGVILLIVIFYLNQQPLYLIMNNQNKKMEKSGFLFLIIISILLTVIIAILILMQYTIFINDFVSVSYGGEW